MAGDPRPGREEPRRSVRQRTGERGLKLTLADIADLRAYERERDQFRSRIIELKRRRRVGVGPLVTFVFENRDTVRFQIQEMARAERIMTDDGIREELRAYNPLIPEPGQLSATMFIELTSDAQLREWLPKLVGVQRAVELRVGTERVAADPDETFLSREDTTASVHYLRWCLSPSQVEAFRDGPVELAIAHPAYRHATPLEGPTKDELWADLQGIS